MKTQLWGILLLALLPSAVLAQSDNSDKSWTSTTEPQQTSGQNRTRTTTSHEESDGRSIDRQSVEQMGINGSFQRYLDTETETVRVNPTTVRRIERRFGRDPDGNKRLLQVGEQEVHTFTDGSKEVVSTISTPDVNGRMQVARREVSQSKPINAETTETKTTVLLPDANGGFAATLRTEQRETHQPDQSLGYKQSTLVPDGHGGWQVDEVRQGVVKKGEGQSSTKEETVLRPDTDGNLAVVQRTVTKESAAPSGQKQQTTEHYSTYLPGTAGNTGLQLDSRVTTLSRTTESGERITEQQVEQRDAANPADGMLPSQKAIDIVRPGLNGGTEETRTIQAPGSNSSLTTVWVDTTKGSSAAVNVDTTTGTTQKK